VARFGTPVQVTDVPTLEVAAERVRAAFPDPWLRAYSVKANDVAAIVARIAGLGFDANVVSRGEWAVARRAGLPNARITLEGIGKTDADLRSACRAATDGEPLRWISIESLDEAEALVRIARGMLQRRGARLDVLFRLNPEVVPETLRELAVGAGTSKFGLTADELSAAVEVVGEARALVPRGIQLHIGSQLRAVDAWRDAIRRGLALLALLSGTRREFDTLDIGGGFPILPLAEAAPDPSRFARELPALLKAIPVDRRPRRMAIEPGRALVARAGFLLARVLHVRERGGREVVLDAGMTELMRPALYGAFHRILPVTPRATAVSPWDVVGPICESSDVFGRDRQLPDLQVDDLVALLDTGAYGAVMASNYNRRLLAPEVLVDEGRFTVIRRRQTIEDVLALES
jgi:diaminopimelate decarboxylase